MLEKKEIIIAFSQVTSIFFSVLFGGIVFYIISKLLSSHSTLETTIITIVLVIIIMASILCYSFQKASITITEESITYSGGFLKKTIKFKNILSANIIQEKNIPSVSYKIWAYYAFGEKNGLFKLKNGKKAYIVGHADTFLYLETKDTDMLFSIDKKGISKNTVDIILQKIKALA